jgi:hypothetical protein
MSQTDDNNLDQWYVWSQNHSTQFVLPLLGFPKTFYGKHLCDTYLTDSTVHLDLPHDHLYVLFSPKKVLRGEKDYFRLEDAIVQMPTFVTKYRVGEEYGEFYMAVFEIPEEYRREFRLFKEGRYTLFGENARKAILHGRPNENAERFFNEIFAGCWEPATETAQKAKIRANFHETLVYDFWKSQFDLDITEGNPNGEVWSIPSTERHTFTLNSLEKFQC